MLSDTTHTTATGAKTGRSLQDAVAAAASDAGAPKLRRLAEFASHDPESFVRMSAREICAFANTSEPTLIRFCRQFGHTGLAEFRIELALAMAAREPGVAFVPQATDRRRVHRAAKQAIARAALALVARDHTLLVDNGSTAEAFALALEGAEAKTILTNGLQVARNALLGGQHRVMLTGGEISPQTGSLSGRMVENSLRDMHFDTFIMGADSIHLPHGISTYSEAEARITSAMLQRAARVIVLADHSKFRRPGLHRICGVQQMHSLVTDRPLPGEIHTQLSEMGVEVIVADAIVPAQWAQEIPPE